MTIPDERLREKFAETIWNSFSARMGGAYVDASDDLLAKNHCRAVADDLLRVLSEREPPADVRGLVNIIRSNIKAAYHLNSETGVTTLHISDAEEIATALEALSGTNAAQAAEIERLDESARAWCGESQRLTRELIALRASFTDEAAVEIGRLREVAYNQAREIEDWKKDAANPDKHRSIYLSIFKHHVSVQLDVAGNWVEVIKEYYDGEGHVSHHVSPLGIETAIQAASQSGGG